MLLKSITLTDFRNFKGVQSIEFAVDSCKNVTIIMGENNSGKTTLAQAFTWCLYGTTDFLDPNVMSKSALQDMKSHETKKTSVKIQLQHKNMVYDILREQEYTLDDNRKIKVLKTKFKISYKDINGNQKFIPDIQCQHKVKEILPSELSGYFFFNGERIEKMSKEIQSGRSAEFASAVKRLLGLDTYNAAITHLKGNVRMGKRSVIGYYNSQYDSSSDERISQYMIDIEYKEKDLYQKRNRKKELEEMLTKNHAEIIRLSNLIESNKYGEQLKRQIASHESTIKRNDAFIGNSTSNVLKSFDNNYKYYFLKKMMADAIEVLSDTDNMDKGIPNIHERTIGFLIQRGMCICGTPISENSSEHKKLMEILRYIPPQSLGTMINNFVRECKSKTEMGENLFQVIKEKLSEIEERQNENEELNANIEAIEDEIRKYKDIGQYQKKLSTYNVDYKKKQSELTMINQQIGALESEIERLNGLRSELSLKDDNNRKIELYKAYAERIHEVLKQDYSTQETKVRKELEKCINEIFKKIYNGGCELEIDGRYNVTTIVKDFANFNVGVEAGTAQSISIIFAFIAGVINIARKNANNDELSTEAYPLVMDAPLSDFDKKRIRTVCDTLPNIAEQVIIFIKDTDGEIAEKYLSDKIGKRYEFDKKNEFETDII